jgi:cell division protein ZapB
MDSELQSLEDKVTQFIALCRRLRNDNHQLRQQLASAQSENRQLAEKIGAAKTRLEIMLSHIPEEEL